MRHGARLTALVLVGLIVAACGQLPRPFQPEDKSGNALLEIPDGAAILVQPLAQGAPGDPAAAAEAMAEALRRHNIPASTRGLNGASRALTGRAAINRLDGGKQELLVHWEIAETDGSRLATLAQRHVVSGDAWRASEPETVARVMDRSAGAIAALIQPAAPAAAAPAEPRAPRVVIGPLATLPGDGKVSLPLALETELRRAGLAVGDTPRDGDLLVDCELTLGPPEGGSQDVRFAWRVTRAGDGRELGRIDQENRIPAGSLDGRWGLTARGVAVGAAEGLRELLARLGGQV